MHLIIVGCGRVGSGLAAELDAQGHSVAVIDRSAEAFRRLPQGFGGTTHTGVGFDRATLIDAGAERADALAAVTSGDNSNIVVARTGREAFEIERVVARIYDPARARIYARLGIHTVATSWWTIDQILRHVRPGRHCVDWTDPTGSLSLIGISLPRGLAGREVHALPTEGTAQVVAITREGAARRVAADTVVQEGDIVHLLVDASEVDGVIDGLHQEGER